MKFKSLMLIFLTQFVVSCASDGPTPPPKLSLNPELLVDESEIGEDLTIKLNVTNQMVNHFKSAYGYDSNLKDLFLDLTSDAFDKLGFSIETDPYYQPNKNTILMTVNINYVQNSVKKKSLKSDVSAVVKISMKARKGKSLFNKNFESTRSQEYALNASTENVEEVVNLAIAQIIKRMVDDKEFLNWAAKK